MLEPIKSDARSGARHRTEIEDKNPLGGLVVRQPQNNHRDCSRTSQASEKTQEILKSTKKIWKNSPVIVANSNFEYNLKTLYDRKSWTCKPYLSNFSFFLIFILISGNKSFSTFRIGYSAAVRSKNNSFTFLSIWSYFKVLPLSINSITKKNWGTIDYINGCRQKK